MRENRNLIVAPKQDVDPALPSHVSGVHQGNAPDKHAKKTSGIELFDRWAFATPRRSTGICAEDRYPIAPESPVLTPP